MKTMTCKQLGGACDTKLHGKSFEEIAQQSKNHVAEMFKANSQPHLNAANAMGTLMKTPGGMEAWYESKRKEFETLPSDK